MNHATCDRGPIRLWFAILIWWLSAGTFAATPALEDLVHWNAPDVESARALVAGATAGDVAIEPSAQGVLDLLRKAQMHVGAAHVEEHVQVVRRFQSASGIEREGTYQFWIDAHSQQVSFLNVVVFSPDGAAEVFDSDSVRMVDAEGTNLYTTTVRLDLPIASLREGSTLVLDYLVRTDLGRRALPWSAIRLPQDNHPVRRYEFVASWENAVDLRWIDRTSFLQCESGRGALSCTGADLPTFQYDDSVWYRDYLPHLVLTTFGDWAELAAAVGDGVGRAMVRSAGVMDVFGQLQDSSDTDVQFVAQAFDLVAREIRYVSESEGLNSHLPHSAQETLDRRFGDCKDKSVLLATLLELGGFEAEAVLVSTHRFDLAGVSLPAAPYFDHMIVCMRDERGSRQCMDPTDSHGTHDLLASHIQGAVALSLGEEDPRPFLLPRPEVVWRMELVTDLEFRADGSQRETTTRTYQSAWAQWQRARLQGMSADDVLRDWEEQYAEVVSSTSEPEIRFDAGADHGADYVVHTVAEFPGVVSPDADLDYAERLYWADSLLHDQDAGNRFYPEQIPGIEVVSTYRFLLPGRWIPRLPGPELQLESRFGSMHRSVRESEEAGRHVVTFESVVRVPYRRVEPDEVAAYNAFVAVIRREGPMRLFAELQGGNDS